MKYRFHHLFYWIFYRLHCWAGSRASAHYQSMTRLVIDELNTSRKLRSL